MRITSEDLSLPGDNDGEIFNFGNAGKFFALSNQLFQSLHSLAPEKNKFISDYFFPKMTIILESIIPDEGRIEQAPPKFDEELLRHGTNLCNFIAASAVAGKEAINYVRRICEILGMLAFRKLTSKYFSELYLTFLEALGKIHDTW